MHIVSKFQFFIHIFAMVKLKKTSPKFESAVSPWIIELKAQYLFQNVAN